MNEQVQSELKKIFNGRFSTSVSTRTNYARGEDTYDPVLSQAVVFPETNSEVSKILKLCNDHKVPVVPFGTGTSLEGNVVGNDKGITMFNSTLSADSILQGISSENITVNQKCYIIDRMFNRTTLTNEEVDEIYRTFMSGKCTRA